MSSNDQKRPRPVRRRSRRHTNSGDDDTGSGHAVVKGFESLLAFVLTVTIFGAGILTTIVAGISDPADSNPYPRFKKDTVRAFLAISWLLFVLALAVGGFTQSLLAFQKEKAGSMEEWRHKWGVAGLVASSVLQLLIIGAFLFLSLTILAYVEVVGWFAVGFTSAAALGVLILLAVQWV
jgi:hypothetical protein